MESSRVLRSLVPIAASLTLITSACGSDGETSGATLPAPSGTGAGVAIDIIDGHPLAAIIQAEQQSLDTVSDGSFDIATSIDAPATTADAYRMDGSEGEVPEEVDRRVAALAAAFGVDGPVELLDADDADSVGRRVGTDATGFVEVVGPAWTDGGHFYFSGSPEQQAGSMPCPTLPDGSCESESATGVPESTAPAEAQIAAVMAAIGIEPDSYQLDAQSFGNSIEFVADFAPDGRRTDLDWRFGVGSSGSIATADGPFSAPASVAHVPLVDLDTAIDRLHSLHPAGSVGAVPLTVPPFTTVADVPATTTVLGGDPSPFETTSTTTTTTTSTTTAVTTIPGEAPTTPASTTVVPPVPGDPFATTTMVPQGDSLPPMPMPTVTVPDSYPASRNVVEVRETVRLFAGSPSGPWLLPTFTFVADDGTTYDVVAVAASEFVVVSAPVPPPTTTDLDAPPQTIPQPMPTLLSSEGTPVTLPVPPGGPGFEPGAHADALRRILVGRPLGEAVPTLEATGWTVQLIDEGVPNVTITADLDPTRARVFHLDDIVTDVHVDRWPDGGAVPPPATTAPVPTTTGPSAPSTRPPSSAPDGTIPLDNPVVTLPDAEEASRAGEDAQASYQERIAELVVGLDTDRAIAELEAVGWTVRIVSEDGVGNDLTDDLRFDRANLTIVDGSVAGVQLF